MDDHRVGFDDLRVRFVFVPDGTPVPWDWMADWTDIVRVPATLVLHYAPEEEENEDLARSDDSAGPRESKGRPEARAEIRDNVRETASVEPLPDGLLPHPPEYRSYAPRRTAAAARPRPADGSFEVAAGGDLRCEGFEAGCSQGGSYGTSAMFEISGSKLCHDCAVKMLGIQDEPAAEKTKVLRPYLMNGR